MNISDEAVRSAQAAFMETLVDRRLKEVGGIRVTPQQRRAIKAAITAAAQHLMAEAWDEGAIAYATRYERDESLPLTNPYRSSGVGE